MTDNINDGGPAFPGAELPGHPKHPPGMSLRDWFAGQALTGFLSHPAVLRYKGEVADREFHYAAMAYELADAMLKQRGES